ncbi:MAG: hypothetical protein IT445_20310 [Phycisphaeraceae bacterium]|nr:hypothetical protein [Phycisphaeraceae bacterium]
MTSEHESIARRLGRIAGLCVTGQSAAAELELCDWLRQPQAPAAARVMFAALLARRGDLPEARRVLGEQPHDPMQLLSLFCLLSRDDQQQDVAHAAAYRLSRQFAHLPLIEQWMSLAGQADVSMAEPDERHIEQLAGELHQQPTLIPTLVVAQQYEPQPQRITLLRQAIARIAPRFAHDRSLVMICQALAELALLAGDQSDAQRWAHRGLKIDPYAAPLALVLAQLDDDQTIGPPAVAVLDRVARQFPAYADVRAALRRRLEAAA